MGEGIKGRVVTGGKWVSVELALDREVFAAPVKSIPLLGRFIMREEGVTLGIGKVTEVKRSKFHKLLCVCLTSNEWEVITEQAVMKVETRV